MEHCVYVNFPSYLITHFPKCVLGVCVVVVLLLKILSLKKHLQHHAGVLFYILQVRKKPNYINTQTYLVNCW